MHTDESVTNRRLPVEHFDANFVDFLMTLLVSLVSRVCLSKELSIICFSWSRISTFSRCTYVKAFGSRHRFQEKFSPSCRSFCVSMTDKKPFQRLPLDARPINYSIRLQPNLKSFTFEGSEEILVKVCLYFTFSSLLSVLLQHRCSFH